METWATVRTRVRGYHRWSDAPDEVPFLRYTHRHEFHVELSFEVDHDDRELEYIQMKRWLEETFTELRVGQRRLPQDEIYFGESSCEMIAKELASRVSERLDSRDRKFRASVFEDGENGAEVEGHLDELDTDESYLMIEEFNEPQPEPSVERAVRNLQLAFQNSKRALEFAEDGSKIEEFAHNALRWSRKQARIAEEKLKERKEDGDDNDD